VTTNSPTTAGAGAERSPRRRGVLGMSVPSAAAVAGALLAGAGSRGRAQAADDQPLVGSWLVAAVPPGAQPGPPRILVSFTGDGVALRTAPQQQAAPPALGTDRMVIGTTHGAWAPLADGAFGLTFIGFAFDGAGAFLAQQRIRVAVRLNDARDGFAGPFQTDFLGADGQVLASSSGTVQGTRVAAEPPAQGA
jgi:hypothetical protein